MLLKIIDLQFQAKSITNQIEFMTVIVPSDQRILLQKVAEGDQIAFKELFDLYRPNIFTSALRIIGDDWIAEEILQDTFLKVWLKRESLPDLENFGGWLYTIARNYTFNAIKNSRRERAQLHQLAHQVIPAEYNHTDYLTQEKEFQDILAQAVARLPEKQRQTYILIKQRDLKRDEAAKELNVSPETVKWNLEQAMKSVRAFCVSRLDEVPPILTLYFLIKYF